MWSTQQEPVQFLFGRLLHGHFPETAFYTQPKSLKMLIAGLPSAGRGIWPNDYSFEGIPTKGEITCINGFWLGPGLISPMRLLT